MAYVRERCFGFTVELAVPVLLSRSVIEGCFDAFQGCTLP
jgi:hypothetical protein